MSDRLANRGAKADCWDKTGWQVTSQVNSLLSASHPWGGAAISLKSGLSRMELDLRTANVGTAPKEDLA